MMDFEMQVYFGEKMPKKGRPTVRPKAKTLFSSRLQQVIPDEGMRILSSKYFLGVSTKTVAKYLSGESEPTVSQLLRISEVTGCSLMWLLTGEGEMEKGEDNA